MITLRGLAACLALAVPATAATEVQEVTSPGGTLFWLVEEPSIPFVAVEIRFQGGASLDPEGALGATYLMAATLEEGSGELDAVAFAEAREALAARIGFDASRDSVSVTAQMLLETRDEVAALVNGALRDPTFADDAVERVREQVLGNIRSEASDPGTVAGLAFRAANFPDHPYGRPMEGTEDSVAALTADDLRAAHAAGVVRSRALVGIAGAVTAEEAGALIDAMLAGLPEEGPPLPARTTLQAEPGVAVTEVQGPQAVALFGLPGLERDDPDFFPAFVMNHILGGGGFSSRLTIEVREERGLTYGIGSSLITFDHADVILGQVASANETVAEAVAVVSDIVADMGANGVTAQELDDAKRYLTGAYPLRFTSNRAIARALAGLQSLGLPADYLETRNDRVAAVTLEQVNAVAARLLDPAELRVTVAGRPEGL